jgi:prepilin-type N-terminal cleavage/methylation domain-containing protein
MRRLEYRPWPRYRRHPQAGFTLIELLVVVVIVSVLASIGLPIYRGYILTVNLGKAVPYLLSISAKQQIRFNRTGKRLTTLSEQDIVDRLGVDVSGAQDFCFMIFCTDATACVDNTDTAATAGTLISTPTGNTPLYQVIAVLRQDDDATVNGAGSTCTVSTNAAKLVPSGWVNTNGTGVGSEGRVVILSYPPPPDGLDTSVSVAGHAVRLDWSQGIAKTDAERP